MEVSWSVSYPARFALVSNVVPRYGLLNAFALDAQAFNASRRWRRRWPAC